MSDTETKERKARYSGEISLSGHADEAEPVKASRIDLGEYETHLKAIPNGMQRGFTVPTAGVSVVKSRFSQAASRMGIGVRFTVVEFGSSQVRPAWQLKEGESRLLVSTGPKRVVTRKPKEAESTGHKPGGLASAVKASAKR